MKAISIFSIFCFWGNAAISQPCSKGDDLLALKGKFLDHTSTPAEPDINKYQGADKAVVQKTQRVLEEIFKKSFQLNGGVAKGWNSFNAFTLKNDKVSGCYQYMVGFYRYVCANGNVKPDHEFSTSLYVTINRDIEPVLYRPGKLADGQYAQYFEEVLKPSFAVKKLPLFSWFTIPDNNRDAYTKDGGYIEGNKEYAYAFDKNPAIRRTYIIKPKGVPVIAVVTRKEFLNAMLEFYEKEKPALQVFHKETIASCDKAMPKVTSLKNVYETYANRKKESEYQLSKGIEENYQYRVGAVKKELQSRSQEWLQEQAVLPENFDNTNLSKNNEHGYYLFKEFGNGPKSIPLYKWNPELMKKWTAPGSPLYMCAEFRKKENVPFSETIFNHFTQNISFDAMRDLLVK